MVQEATELYDRAMERGGLVEQREREVSNLAQEARLAAKNAVESLDRMNFGLSEEEQVSGLLRIMAGLDRAQTAVANAVNVIRAGDEGDGPENHPEGPPPADGQPVVPPPDYVDDPEGGVPTVPSEAPYGDEDAENGDPED